MKTIDIVQLDSITGGLTPYQHCRNQVTSKALKFAGDDNKLSLGETRELIGSVQRNGFHACERAGMRGVFRNVEMTGPAQKKLDSFLTSVD